MNERAVSSALLLLRLLGMVLLWSFHVARKLADFGSEWETFPDPLSVGHAASLVLALGAEAGCSVLVGLGLFARLASLPILLSMSMVFLLSARGFADADLQAALLYFALYAAIAIAGPGKYQVLAFLPARAARALAWPSQ